MEANTTEHFSADSVPCSTSPSSVSRIGRAEQKAYHKVSPTAVSCAAARALFTDMPYAMDVFREVAGGGGSGIGFRIRNMVMKVAIKMPFVTRELSRISVLEGRHYANNAALSRFCPEGPILEMAAGLSTRGLELGNHRVYIETDLEEMLEQKREIAGAVLMKRGQGIPSDHLFLPMNALDYSQLKEAAGALRELEPDKPFALIHEGLMMFLDDVEQATLRDNIYRLFQEMNPDGWWITTDFSFKSEEYFNPSYRKHVEKGTERAFNCFASDEEVAAFLEQGGFRVEMQESEEIARKLSCIKKVGMKIGDVMKYANQYRVAVATLK